MRGIFIKSRFAPVALLAFTFAMARSGAPQPILVIHAVRIDHPLRVTGTMTDPEWQRAPGATIGFEIQPAENVPAPQNTIVKVLYDEQTLYIGFICYDSAMAAIRAHTADRDKIFDDDFVIAIIDTYGDRQRAYEFVVNPVGIQGDLMRNGNNEDASFDAVWSSAASKNDSSWTVEMAIPFKSLRFPPERVQHWSVMMGRIYPRASRSIFFTGPIDRNNPCLMCQGVPLEGIEGIQATSSLEVLPYVLGSQQSALHDAGDPASGFHDNDIQGHVGGSFKYVPTPAVTVEGVLNPDFSQVESDADQISVNSSFALYYPEKRPFFFEGADLFQNRSQTFYSRTINNPIGATKLIAKTGGLSLSYLGAEDRNTPFIIPGEEGSDVVSSSLRSISNIGRARYDFGDESFLGAMLTTRNFSDAHNYVGGIDWNYTFGGFYRFQGELFSSSTKEVNDTTLFSSSRLLGSTHHTASFDGESFAGTSANVVIRRDARDYSFSFTYLDVSPTFQAQTGFVTRSDARMLFTDQYYALYPEHSMVDKAFVDVSGGLHFNYDNARKERWIVPTVGVQLKSQTNISVTYFVLNEELFDGVQFRNVPRGSVDISSAPSTNFLFSLHLEDGHYIYRGSPTDLGTGHQVNAQVTLKPTGNFQLDLSFARARLRSLTTDGILFDGNISRLVATYQFTPEMFLRFITQYNSFNTELSVFPLFSYKLNAFTIFYAGSTDDLTNFGGTNGFVTTTRQYFVKLQYLWRS